MNRSLLDRAIARLQGTAANIPVGHVRFGDLRRTAPLSQEFGYDRGTPIDRYYIERFLLHNAPDIHGRVLEIGDDTYTRQFGRERVKRRDVLHVHEDNPAATIVGDLSDSENVPSNAFDCVILTQTLHLIFDLEAAVHTLHRILKASGVLLLTVPGISQLSADEWADTWYWSFTPLSIRRLFGVFGQNVTVESYGNVLAAASFLYGIASEELLTKELDQYAPHFPMLITLRAVRTSS